MTLTGVGALHVCWAVPPAGKLPAIKLAMIAKAARTPLSLNKGRSMLMAYLISGADISVLLGIDATLYLAARRLTAGTVKFAN
jgi:hypothetical protein